MGYKKDAEAHLGQPVVEGTILMGQGHAQQSKDNAPGLSALFGLLGFLVKAIVRRSKGEPVIKLTAAPPGYLALTSDSAILFETHQSGRRQKLGQELARWQNGELDRIRFRKIGQGSSSIQLIGKDGQSWTYEATALFRPKIARIAKSVGAIIDEQ